MCRKEKYFCKKLGKTNYRLADFDEVKKKVKNDTGIRIKVEGTGFDEQYANLTEFTSNKLKI